MASLAIVLGMLAHGKSSTVEPGWIVKVIAIGYAVKVSRRSQSLSHRSGLALGMVASIFFVSTGVESFAVKAEGHGKKVYQ